MSPVYNSVFVLDASGLIAALNRPGPVMQATKLTQIANQERLRVPSSVIVEASQRPGTTRDWLDRNRQQIEIVETTAVTKHVPRIRRECHQFTGFLSSVPDVMVVCSALALTESALESNDNTEFVVVATDGQLEAACFAMGIQRLSPSAFVHTFASLALLN